MGHNYIDEEAKGKTNGKMVPSSYGKLSLSGWNGVLYYIQIPKMVKQLPNCAYMKNDMIGIFVQFSNKVLVEYLIMSTNTSNV